MYVLSCMYCHVRIVIYVLSCTYCHICIVTSTYITLHYTTLHYSTVHYIVYFPPTCACTQMTNHKHLTTPAMKVCWWSAKYHDMYLYIVFRCIRSYFLCFLHPERANRRYYWQVASWAFLDMATAPIYTGKVLCIREKTSEKTEIRMCDG